MPELVRVLRQSKELARVDGWYTQEMTGTWQRLRVGRLNAHTELHKALKEPIPGNSLLVVCGTKVPTLVLFRAPFLVLFAGQLARLLSPALINC